MFKTQFIRSKNLTVYQNLTALHIFEPNTRTHFKLAKFSTHYVYDTFLSIQNKRNSYYNIYRIL